MNGLNIFTSNCMETLAEQLALIVRAPLSSPFSPEIIVVQSRGMERWVAMELAGHNGICANCFFPFPNTFLQEMFNETIPDLPEESSFDPLTMTFKIMKDLPECIHLPGFENLKRYLQLQPEEFVHNPSNYIQDTNLIHKNGSRDPEWDK